MERKKWSCKGHTPSHVVSGSSGGVACFSMFLKAASFLFIFLASSFSRSLSLASAFSRSYPKRYDSIYYSNKYIHKYVYIRASAKQFYKVVIKVATQSLAKSSISLILVTLRPVSKM